MAVNQWGVDTSGKPEIVELGDGDLRGKGEGYTNTMIQRRRPFVYYPEDHQVVVGPRGTFHNQIAKMGGGIAFGGIMDDDWRGNGAKKAEVLNFGGVPDHVLTHIADHYGIGQEEKGTWNFAKVAEADPYYDPEFPDDNWEDKMGDEMVADMHRKGTPAELEQRLSDGILPGQQGKGLELPDGSKHFWKTDGTFGWPHHDEMLRHLRVFNRDGIKHLHVDRDGEVSGGDWADEGWKF